MLCWTLMFLFVAMLAGMLGFGGLAVGAVGIAKFLCVLFLALCAMSMLCDGWIRRPIS